MNILFDIGNTSIDWAIEEQGEFSKYGKMNHGAIPVHDGLDKQFHMENLQPEHILLANVGDSRIMASLTSWVEKYWQVELWQAQVLSEFNGLKNSYTDTRQMGVDRWLAMVAAWDSHKSALCIVSCGTALTIDLIDESGQHLGGYIMPGINLMQQALVQNTEQINSPISNTISIDLAKDTSSAINHGACLAAIATIDRAVAMSQDKYKLKATCIITGGAASLIKPALNQTFLYEPDIVLRGLSLSHKAMQ